MLPCHLRLPLHLQMIQLEYHRSTNPAPQQLRPTKSRVKAHAPAVRDCRTGDLVRVLLHCEGGAKKATVINCVIQTSDFKPSLRMWREGPGCMDVNVYT